MTSPFPPAKPGDLLTYTDKETGTLCTAEVCDEPRLAPSGAWELPILAKDADTADTTIWINENDVDVLRRRV